MIPSRSTVSPSSIAVSACWTGTNRKDSSTLFSPLRIGRKHSRTSNRSSLGAAVAGFSGASPLDLEGFDGESKDSSSFNLVRTEDVTSHQTVVRSCRIRHILQVEDNGFFCCCPFEFDVSLPEDDISSLESLDSLYPESSEAFSVAFFFSSTPVSKESSEDDWSPLLSYRALSSLFLEKSGTCFSEESLAVALLAVTEAPVTSSLGPLGPFLLSSIIF
mmetsp:Transcript_45031/g.108929  ORF Transcript_45031/g.108929 Transcript_45031/m.108929 type:complete len:218 (+) Transcript_45031:425-1078(+)